MPPNLDRRNPPPEDDPRFRPRVYRNEKALAVIAPTWEVSPKFTYNDFVEAYRRNPHAALRDFASVPSYAVEAFFRDPELLTTRANRDRFHPIQDDLVLSPELMPGNFHYFVHVDLAKTRDNLGFAMAHYDANYTRTFPDIGEVKGMVVVDFMLEIIAEPGHDIDFERVRTGLIYPLKSRGFYLRKITYDQFQSVEMQQQLNKRSIPNELYSVDKNTEAYDTFLELLLFARVDYYFYPSFDADMKKLILKDGRKVDHPPKGKKDVCDAVVGAVRHAKVSAGLEPRMMSSTISHEQAFQRAAETPNRAQEQRKRAELLGWNDETYSTYF